MTNSRTNPDVAPEISDIAARRRRRLWWLFRGLILLAVLVGQEALFRLLFPLPEVEGFNRARYQAMDPSRSSFAGAREWGLSYNRLLLESSPDGFTSVDNLNRYGFRGPDFAIEPDPGRRRILVIGDSVTEGMGADDAGTFPADWSRLLAEDGVSAEVINLGVMGAGLADLWSLLRDSVPLLKPADVVVMLYANDLPAPATGGGAFNETDPEFPRTADLLWRPRLAVLVDRLIVEKPICRWWPHRVSRFFTSASHPDSANPWSGNQNRPRGLSERLFQAMNDGTFNPFVQAQALGMPTALSYDFAKWGSPRPYLEHMARFCHHHGARLIVGYVPFQGVVGRRYADPLVELGVDRATAEALSTDPKYRSQNRIVADVCHELKLPLADATGALEAAEASGRAQFLEFDGHPNANGYATIAARVHAVWRSAVGDGLAAGK